MSELSEEYLAWRRQQARIARQTPDRQSMTHASPRPEALAPEARVPMPFRFMGERYETPLRIPESNAEAAERTSQMMLPQGPGDIALGVALGPMAKMGTGILSTLARGAVGGTGLSMDPERAEAMFASLYARRPPMSALKQAEVMKQARKPPSYIHEDTGIHYGPEGQPRFEIDDSRARLTLPPRDRAPIPAERAWDHGDLWDQYPDIGRDYGVEVRSLGPGVRGAFDERNKTIYINPNAPNLNDVMAHEVQHAIQHYEGLPGGSSQQQMPALMAIPMVRRLEDLTARLFTQGKGAMSSDEMAEIGELQHALKLLRSDPAARERAYFHSAGEAEAFNTMDRRTWDAEMRAKTPPSASLRVPESELIINPSYDETDRIISAFKARPGARIELPGPELEPMRNRLIQYARELENR